MGVAIRITWKDLDRLVGRIDGLGNPDAHQFLDSVGSLVESQTKARIAAGGPAPSGQPWAAWSARYAKTRHAGQSLLFSEGRLLDSFTHDVVGEGVVVGSVKPYARIHQLGGQIVLKARSGTLRLRTTGSRGKLMRQGPQGRMANLAVFARGKDNSHPHVHFTERLYQIAQQTITMPARPYLGLSPSDEAEVTDMAAQFILRALQ